MNEVQLLEKEAEKIRECKECKKGQIGSSTMPQKGRNPIDYENSEGNAIVANWVFEGFSRELPNSRFQRHLSDSTIARNIGVAFAHTFLAWENARSDLVIQF
jgi:adenylosuccinate lyase